MLRNLLIICLLMSANAHAYNSDKSLQECEARYEAVAGPIAHNLLNSSFIPTFDDEDYTSLLSYEGPNVISYDGTRFQNRKGVLTTTVQQVMASKKADQLNATLVHAFLSSADNDSDYPEVQLMAIALQPKFPNLPLDVLIYWAISNKLDQFKSFPFCKGNLWTWAQIVKWFETTGIPVTMKSVLKDKENYASHISDKPLCEQKTIDHESTIVCSNGEDIP